MRWGRIAFVLGFALGGLLLVKNSFDRYQAETASLSYVPLSHKSSAQAAAVPPPLAPGAVVVQKNYRVVQASNPLFFNVEVSLKNVGQVRAVAVQARVFPFAGTLPEVERNHFGMPNSVEGTPEARIGQWISFGEIGSGETRSGSCQFMKQGNNLPNTSGKLEIIYAPAPSDR